RGGEVSNRLLSPDGRRLVTWPDFIPTPGLGPGETILWDVDTGKPRPLLTGSILGVLFSPDGKRFAAKLPDEQGRLLGVAGSTEVKVWDADSGAELAHLKEDRGIGHTAFSPDGKRLATAVETDSERAGEVLVWDVATG